MQDYKSAAALLANEVQTLLNQLNSFNQQDQALKTESCPSAKRDKWIKLEKFRRQLSCTGDENIEVIFDVRPKVFWDDSIGFDKKEVAWSELEAKMKEKFKNQLEKFCTGEHDTDWLMEVIKLELSHTNEKDESFVSKDRLVEFCSTGKVSLKRTSSALSTKKCLKK